MVVVKGPNTKFQAVEIANVVETTPASGTATIGNIGRLGTIGEIAHLGSIANTKFNQGSISEYRRDLWGYDYIAAQRSVRVDTEGRLQTVAAAGTATIGNIGRIGTVGAIAHLGSIANSSFNQGSISDHIRYMYGWQAAGTARFVKVNAEGKLETVSTLEGGTVNVSNMPSDYMKKEDDYDFQSYDLNTARASPGSTLGITGDSLTVFSLSGSCSLRFNGTAKPAIPVNELTYPQMIVFERTYTNIYLQNTSQSGKTVKLYFGKRT